MKITGVGLIMIGVMLFLFGGVSYMMADAPTDDQPTPFPLNPTFTFVVAAGCVAAGLLIMRYGGKGFTRTRRLSPTSGLTKPPSAGVASDVDTASP